MTAHLRMNAVYWGLTALCIMKHKDALDAQETIEYVMSCWDDEAGAPQIPSLPPFPLHTGCSDKQKPLTPGSNFFIKGAFGAHPGHDAHILSTLSAIQILATHDALAQINAPRVIDCKSVYLHSASLQLHPTNQPTKNLSLSLSLQSS